MKAMILAAGEGRRMLPLTQNRPKPLLKVAGRSLIEHQITRLVNAGFQDIVINVSYLGDQIINKLGHGDLLNCSIQYSREEQPLETGGGIRQALPLLGDAPFLLINGDVWCDFKLEKLKHWANSEQWAHLVLVENPSHNPHGDFILQANGLVTNPLKNSEETSRTFSGISVIHPKLITEYPQQRIKFPLGEALRHACHQGRVGAEIHLGDWLDVGTPERLQQLNLSQK